MPVYVQITKHNKRFISDEGIEVYPPGHPQQGMAKPASERTGRGSLPPKSLAEERVELEAKREASMNKGDRAALERLKKKGLI